MMVVPSDICNLSSRISFFVKSYTMSCWEGRLMMGRLICNSIRPAAFTFPSEVATWVSKVKWKKAGWLCKYFMGFCIDWDCSLTHSLRGKQLIKQVLWGLETSNYSGNVMSIAAFGCWHRSGILQLLMFILCLWVGGGGALLSTLHCYWSVPDLRRMFAFGVDAWHG